MISDSDSWRTWLSQHGPALLLYARQFCPSRSDAEDAMQDGFVKFWKTRARVNDPAAYLYTCVRSGAIDLSRTARRHEKQTAHAPMPRPPLLESPLERSEQRDLIESALTKLPPEQREILILKIWANLTFSQIATTLNLNSNTVASRYRYAIEHLHQQLSPELAQ